MLSYFLHIITKKAVLGNRYFFQGNEASKQKPRCLDNCSLPGTGGGHGFPSVELVTHKITFAYLKHLIIKKIDSCYAGNI